MGINFTKIVPDVSTRDNKTLLDKEDLNNWRDTPCPWIGGPNIVKMTVVPKRPRRFNTIPFKMPVGRMGGGVGSE